jgi:hypothetical protein
VVEFLWFGWGFEAVEHIVLNDFRQNDGVFFLLVEQGIENARKCVRIRLKKLGNFGVKKLCKDGQFWPISDL